MVKNNINAITENEFAHWLFNVPGIGNKSIDKLLCGGMTCKEIYEASEGELKEFITPKMINNLMKSKRVWDFEKEKEKLKSKEIEFISRIDERFPDKLKNIPDAPFAIYYKGKLPDPFRPSVAIVGARFCSDYGRFMARSFGRGLALSGVQIISGMARGIDGVSQNAAIAAGGSSFGVVGSGADICYPEENIELYDNLCSLGGVISEYPPGTMPKACFFPMRNRIISGLADIVLVIEAREKSGTQITVDTALEQGKEVLAVPGRVTDRLSDGCNMLISQGAGVALHVEDVLERLDRFTFKQVSQINETAKNQKCEEKKHISGDCAEKTELKNVILETLDVFPVNISQILESLNSKDINLGVSELMGYLMDMICSGTVVQDGAYYRKRS